MRFNVIDDAAVILRSRGVYKQAKVYQREAKGETGVYAASGSGFIRLLKNGGTSLPNQSWDEIEGVEYDFKMSRMIVKGS